MDTVLEKCSQKVASGSNPPNQGSLTTPVGSLRYIIGKFLSINLASNTFGTNKVS